MVKFDASVFICWNDKNFRERTCENIIKIVFVVAAAVVIVVVESAISAERRERERTIHVCIPYHYCHITESTSPVSVYIALEQAIKLQKVILI